MGDAVLQRLDLCLHAHLGGRQSGNAHFHLDILHAALFLGGGSHLFHFANGSLGKVLNAHLGNQVVNGFFLNWGRFHCYSFVLQSID